MVASIDSLSCFVPAHVSCNPASICAQRQVQKQTSEAVNEQGNRVAQHMYTDDVMCVPLYVEQAVLRCKLRS